MVKAAVGSIIYGYKGFGTPQRRVGVNANIYDDKLLEMTTFPTPMIGKKLAPYEAKQQRPQPGKAGGLETTNYHFLMI